MKARKNSERKNSERKNSERMNKERRNKERMNKERMNKERMRRPEGPMRAAGESEASTRNYKKSSAWRIAVDL